ncbi:hypothetical protein RJT34_21704 [Clitoria ternatea]|uniref:peroxidase n=1 Tax=Clitoria ternatea TaxID=43366 RepID=A0AAN9IUN1_CLITE
MHNKFILSLKGCDASILIDSKNNSKAEKDASDSIFLRGFDVIDEIKENVETACPSTVSCADIIPLAARDALGLAGGPRYEVPTGRRDGLRSNSQDVDIPEPDDPVPDIVAFFNQKGFTLTEMVTLFGAHTVGVAHCGFFEDGLRGRDSDPNMDPTLRA